MENLEKKLEEGNLTQIDLVKLMIHNAQHMVTREEVKSDIQALDTSLNTKIDKVEASLNTKIDKVEVSLNTKIDKLDTKIDKVESKLDRMYWLIVATMLSVFLKDYILGFLN